MGRLVVKRNNQVVMLLSFAGEETASLQTVERVRNGRIKLLNIESTEFLVKNGLQTDVSFLGGTHRIVQFEEV